MYARWALLLLMAVGCRTGSAPASDATIKPRPAPAEKSTTRLEKTKKAKKKTARPALAPPKKRAPPPPPPLPAPAIPEEPVPAPSAPVAAVQPPPRTTEPPATDAAKVLILGDSMAATDFGRALEQRINAHAGLVAARRGKSATGLARPDFFDWMQEAERQINKHQPDLVVVIIGGNDGQDLIPKEQGRRVIWNKPKWKGEYIERVQAFARLLIGEKRRLAWIELPAMDRRRFERKLTFIRQVQKEALAALGPRVRYVDTKDIFYDDGGRLRRKISAGGKQVALRQDDGIHFSLPGSQYFADQVYPALLEIWSLKP